MIVEKFNYEFIAQAETLLIYGIFLFLTGLAQIGVTIGHRYIAEQTTNQTNSITITSLFDDFFTVNNIHQWYIFPSAALVSSL